MSRVPDKVKQGSRVLWEDGNDKGLESVIISGIAQNYRESDDTWLVTDIRIHSLESAMGVPSDDFSQASRLWSQFRPKTSVLKVIG